MFVNEHIEAFLFGSKLAIKQSIPLFLETFLGVIVIGSIAIAYQINKNKEK